MKKIIPYLITILLGMYMIYDLFNVVEVNGDSMSPLITSGQVIYGIKSEHYERNNIVIADVNIDGKQIQVVKRIYGVEGDWITISGNKVMVDDKVVKILKNESPHISFILGKNEYFLLGDNPNTAWMRVNESRIISRLELVK